VHAYQDPDDLPQVDLIFIGLKTTANDQYEHLVGPPARANSHAAILTAQNGLGNEEQLAALFGPERIYGGLAFLCSNRRDDGTIHHLDYGYLHVGKYKGEPDTVIKDFVRLMEKGGIPCLEVGDLALARWKKLEWNVPFSGLSTELDLTSDKIMANPILRQRAFTLMQEIQAAAAAHGYVIADAFLEKMMIDTDKMKPYYSSMHLDRRAGRPMEIESIFGEPLRLAQAKGVAVPELHRLYQALKQLM
jgi:2-dehydropantoate 2-reductase